jgi:ActR/RegA family two-component response regulator
MLELTEERWLMMTHLKSPAVLDQRLVLAHPDANFAHQAKRRLQRLGWEVHLTRSGAAARRLARKLLVPLVVLNTELPDESGWLVCRKMNLENPDVRVILVGSGWSAADARLAEFVGAVALVAQEEGSAALSREVNEGAASMAW